MLFPSLSRNPPIRCANLLAFNTFIALALWLDFHAHLDSLETFLPELRTIESLTVPA